MIEQLRSAGDQFRAAWENYSHVCSTIQNYHTQIKAHPYGFRPELIRQLDTELAFISWYEPKIQETKAVINRARNRLSSLTPINTLPPEILIRIFHLVLARPCDLRRLSDRSFSGYSHIMRQLEYPDHLAQVCALWRRVAISSGSLWRHIDLLVNGPYYSAFIPRAETFMARVGELSIELHIMANNYSYNPGSNRAPHECEDLFRLFSRISNRVETLHIRTTGGVRNIRRVFRELWHRRLPDFTKLFVQTPGGPNPFVDTRFFNSTGPDETPGDSALDLTADQPESNLAQLTVLHLHGLFPIWSSVAYHGLVDLRLLSKTVMYRIEEAVLIAILKSSPGLQILHFELGISRPTPENEKISPVTLPDLQVIKLFGSATLCPSSLLRLLAPGAKPLRLAFNRYYKLEKTLITELEEFFARSRVERFYTRAHFPPMDLILRYAARLEHVIIHYSKHDNQKHGTPPFSRLPISRSSPLPRLRSLHIMGSNLFVDELRSLVEYCPSGILLRSCRVNRDGSGKESELSTKELSDAFPNVRTAEYTLYPWEDPTADWDVLG